MLSEPTQPRPPSLKRYFVASLCVHAILFTGIVYLVLHEQARVARQEENFITDLKQQELEREAAEKKAREESMKELLADQLQAEMDQLIAEELEKQDEARLSDLTADDIAQRLDDVSTDLSATDFSNEQFYAMNDQLRGEAFEQMRANLKQMQQDLLLSQVRTFIRQSVAPEIKAKIEQKLRDEVGNRIETEARTQSAQERNDRLTQAAAALADATRELAAIHREQENVRAQVTRRQTGPASTKQEELETRAAENAKKVDEALQTVARATPAVAAEAEALREQPADRKIEPAVAAAKEAVAKAAGTQQAAAAIKPKDPIKPEADQIAAEARTEAETAAQESRDRMAERLKDLQAIAAKVTQAQRERQPDAIQKQVVDEALRQVAPGVRERVEKEVEETAIPLAADRIVQALQKDLEQRDLNNREFKEFLEKDIRQALHEELAERKPDAAVAAERTREAFDLRDSEALEEARKEAAETAKKLAALAEKQEKIESEAKKESTVADAVRQGELAKEIEAVKGQARRTIDRVRVASLTQDKAANQAAAEVNRAAAETAARKATASLEQEKVDEARPAMKEAAQALRDAAQAVEAVAKGIEQEAADVRERAAEKVDLAKALGDDKAKAAVDKTAEAVDKRAESDVKPAVERVARSVNVDRILQKAEDAERLARMSALEDKLDQVAANMAEGRGFGADLGMGLLGPGQGSGPGGLPSDLEWTVPGAHNLSQLNRKALEEFIKDMRNRLNPENYYADVEETAGLDSQAAATQEEGAAVIFVEPASTDQAAADPAAKKPERRIAPPDFTYKEFGAAPMMEKRPVIDGDLSDWGELTHGLRMQYRGNSLDKIPDGPTVYVRWSPDGMYFAYTLKDSTGIQPCAEHSWSGDCLEVMVDTANTRRKDAYMNPTAQKFNFSPFGCRGNKNITISEMGRGLRGLRMASDYPDLVGSMGSSAARLTADGYTVECFIDRRGFAWPQLIPGKYVAMNFSLNFNYGAPGYQWSASQALQTWHRPDTWGDLLLLGADAKLRFISAEAAESDADAEPLKGIVTNDPLGLEVHDADMNINTLKVDRVAAEVRSRTTGSSLFVVLRETGPNTGVFRGSVNTQPYFLPARENTLNVRGGDHVELVFNDLRAEYGEQNREVKAELPVGWPVMKLGSAQ